MDKFFDMHCHLDFANDSQDIASKMNENNLYAIDSTVIPSSFVSAKEKFKAYENVSVGLGFHPWWISDGRVGEADLSNFNRQLTNTHIIGEVGLDFLKHRRASLESQVNIFTELLEMIQNQNINRQASYLIFIHAVKSSSTVIDLLQKHNIFDTNTVVFHWFSGNEDEFGRALSLGSYFSVGMRMLATPTGREYAKAIPDEVLLLESDNPPHEGSDFSIDLWRHDLNGALGDLSQLREENKDVTLQKINQNSEKLILRYAPEMIS